MNFAIEKTVPMPTLPSTYPFQDLEVGDSFAVPKTLAVAVRSARQVFESKNEKTFITRTIGDEVRVWRTA